MKHVHAKNLVMGSFIPEPQPHSSPQPPAPPQPAAAPEPPALASPDVPPPDTAPPAAAHSADVRREVTGLFESLLEAPRREILLALCTAPDGRANPTRLCRLTEFSRTVVSHHLQMLEHRGLIVADESERPKVWYSPNPARVRLKPHEDGERYVLAVIGPDGNEVTWVVPVKREVIVVRTPTDPLVS